MPDKKKRPKTTRMLLIEARTGQTIEEVMIEAYRESGGSYDRAGKNIDDRGVTGKTFRTWVRWLGIINDINAVREELTEKGIRRQGRRSEDSDE
jgi:hypothetical protein